MILDLLSLLKIGPHSAGLLFQIARKAKESNQNPELHAVEVEVDAYEDNDIICVDLDVDGKPPKIELDSVWAVSIFSFDLYR